MNRIDMNKNESQVAAYNYAKQSLTETLKAIAGDKEGYMSDECVKAISAHAGLSVFVGADLIANGIMHALGDDARLDDDEASLKRLDDLVSAMIESCIGAIRVAEPTIRKTMRSKLCSTEKSHD